MDNDFFQRTKRTNLLLFFLIPFTIGMLYALYTDHRWEDWYITYRASKNLATGEGLTYTAGERVYSYTSPINTLLPSFFAALFPSNADEYAIWLYRLVNCFVLGICGVLLLRLSILLKFSKPFSLLLLFLFATNSLIIDNSINGMEAPYMMLFLIFLFLALHKKENARLRDFILPFTGLMYTRPDGFVYAGIFVFAFLIFDYNKSNSTAFWKNTQKIIQAALLSFLLFLPWIFFTWYYYGSPVPNTIIAKSIFRDWHWWTFVKEFIKFPLSIFHEPVQYVLSGLFMPGYAVFGGWHSLDLAGRVVSCVAFFAFLFPFLPKAARTFSLAVYLIVFYLTIISGQGGQPWYLPNLALPVILFFCLVLQAGYNWSARNFFVCVGYVFLSYQLIILLFGAFYFKTQQQIVECGNRKKIGEWLQAQAHGSRETVFLECLGYIGFYSQLKMYDYPGMSSPEVVRILKEGKQTNNVTYSLIIAKLHPDWVVLRPWEVSMVEDEMPGLLKNNYREAKIFSVKDQIPQVWYLMGKPYLEHDAVFVVFRKK
ncbi:MAG TPA: hypothetical protein VNB90_05215 [Cytophagaceae bacterium]|nr:hypothetical protein [Cytophagaceae bacterium]